MPFSTFSSQDGDSELRSVPLVSGPRSEFSRADSFASSIHTISTADFWADSSNRHSVGGFSCLTQATSLSPPSECGHGGEEARQQDDEEDIAALVEALRVEPVHFGPSFASRVAKAPPPPVEPRFECKNINRSLKTAGLPGSPSSPVFPLRRQTSDPNLCQQVDAFETTLSPPRPTLPHVSASTPALPSGNPSSPPPVSAPSPLSLSPSTNTEGESTTTPSVAEIRTQPLRWSGDLFTPQLVRGTGDDKEGFCALCASQDEDGRQREKWLPLKSAAYWYHVSFLHGISSKTGIAFDHPVAWTLCEVFRPDRSACKTPWFVHANKCHPVVKPASASA
ncbi:hypothetical protein JCM10213_001030 [Rhodosporidiobolus nylandii]